MSVSLLFTAMLLALVASPHCSTMCGCALAKPWLGAGKGTSSFMAGRLVAYTGLGLVAGGASMALSHFVTAQMGVLQTLHWVLMAVVGMSAIVMIALARPIVRESTISLSGLKGGGVATSNNGPQSRAFGVGLLWFALPCGVLYSAVSLAYLSGSVWQGGMLMLVFGLFSSGSLLLASRVQQVLGKWFSEPAINRINGVLVLVGLSVVLMRDLGWLSTPAVLEGLGFCL